MWTRREFARIGIGFAGCGLVDLLRLRAEPPRAGQATAGTAAESPEPPRRARQAILIWLDGGPSHLETWDLKPGAPSEVRGPFAAIPTNVPGIAICELFPRVARQADRLAIVRSMTSPLGEHNFGTHYLLTGYKPTPVLEYPAFGAVVAHVRGADASGTSARDPAPALPAHVAVPDFQVGGGTFRGQGFLPGSAQVFAVRGDPARDDFQVRDLEFPEGVDATRLQRRRRFTRLLDGFQESLESDPAADHDPAFEQAFRLVTSPEAKRAFNLQEESAAIRQRYGARSIGQCCLLARRLVERHVPFVTVKFPGWDTHQRLYTQLKEGFVGAKEPVGLIPSLDSALAALLDDLDERGLLAETLVVVMGEFGRTPKLNAAGGRDHWPRVFSVVLAGAGIPGGQVIGRSDSVAESPADQPVTPADMAATIYTLLGIAPSRLLTTPDGRPVPVSRDGRIIRELIG